MAVHGLFTFAKVLVAIEGPMVLQAASLHHEDSLDTGGGYNKGGLLEDTEDEVLIAVVWKFVKPNVRA